MEKDIDKVRKRERERKKNIERDRKRQQQRCMRERERERERKKQKCMRERDTERHRDTGKGVRGGKKCCFSAFEWDAEFSSWLGKIKVTNERTNNARNRNVVCASKDEGRAERDRERIFLFWNCETLFSFREKGKSTTVQIEQVLWMVQLYFPILTCLL